MIKYVLILTVASFIGFMGCDDDVEEPDTEETVGEEVEEAAEETGDAVEEAGEETDEAIDDVNDGEHEE